MPDNNSNVITAATLASFAGVRFADGGSLSDFFAARKGAQYGSWFNATLANRGPWADVTLIDTPANRIGFHQFWNQLNLMFGGSITVVQFAALMSILSNEVRGDFRPRSEKMGVAGHPGMSYLFDKIGDKRSYNKLSGNMPAFNSFNDPGYIAAHGALPLGAKLARTADECWKGESFPRDFATAYTPLNPSFISEADFVKFRGRGFIQTTGRTNYLPLIEFVQLYQGDNATIDYFAHNWKDLSAIRIASDSTNDDWDRLFQHTDLIVATEAIRAHSVRSGNYLNLGMDPNLLNGTTVGSLFFMGFKISGSTTYGKLFAERVAAILTAIA